MRTVVLAVVVVACSKPREPHDLAVPVNPPVEWGGPAIDCAKLLDTTEVRKACGRRVLDARAMMEGIEADPGPEHGGAFRKICARQFKFSESDPYDMIAFDINAYATDELAAVAMGPIPDPQPIPGTTGAITAVLNLHNAVGTRGRLFLNVNYMSPKPVCPGMAELYAAIDRRLAELVR
jgi:hypothetical protein